MKMGNMPGKNLKPVNGKPSNNQVGPRKAQTPDFAAGVNKSVEYYK